MSSSRVVGFVMIAVALVGTLAAFSIVENYAPQRGFVRNLGEAFVFSTYEYRQSEENCPEPPRLGSEIFLIGQPRTGGCPDNRLAYELRARVRTPTYTATTKVKTFSISLGAALAPLLAVALIGTGLIIFGRPRAT